MKFNSLDVIEYLADVTSPPSQAGKKGQVKVVDRDISIWAANYLASGGYVRPYDPAKPLKIKTDDKRSSKKERSKKSDGQGQGKTKSKGNQTKDNESS